MGEKYGSMKIEKEKRGSVLGKEREKGIIEGMKYYRNKNIKEEEIREK